MRIEIIDETKFDSIDVICENNTYSISESAPTAFDIEGNSASLQFIINDKNKVFVNVIDLLFGCLGPDGIICDTNCNYCCEIECMEETCRIQLESLSSGCKSIYYNSVFVDSENTKIKNSGYALADIKNIKTKYLLLHSIFILLLPLLVLIAVLTKFTLFLVIAIMLALFVFTIPSIKQISFFNKNCNGASAAMLLGEAENKKRIEKNTPDSEKQQNYSKLEKAAFKVLDKIFK